MISAAGVATSLVPTILQVAAFVVGLVLVRGRTTGTRRSLGFTGLALLAFVTLLRGVATIVFPLLYGALGDNWFNVYNALSVVLTITYLIGTILVIQALVAPDAPTPAPAAVPTEPVEPEPDDPDVERFDLR